MMACRQIFQKTLLVLNHPIKEYKPVKFKVIGSFFWGKLLLKGKSYADSTSTTHGESVEIFSSVIIIGESDNRVIEYLMKVNIEQLLFLKITDSVLLSIHCVLKMWLINFLSNFIDRGCNIVCYLPSSHEFWDYLSVVAHLQVALFRIVFVYYLRYSHIPNCAKIRFQQKYPEKTP